jgi:hypothetical protein
MTLRGCKLRRSNRLSRGDIVEPWQSYELVFTASLAGPRRTDGVPGEAMEAVENVPRTPRFPQAPTATATAGTFIELLSEWIDKREWVRD